MKLKSLKPFFPFLPLVSKYAFLTTEEANLKSADLEI